MNDLWIVIVFIYFLAHLPAIILLIIGLSLRKSKPETAKILFVLTGIYFIIGGGICGMLIH
jgi:hypothetical protein